MPRKLLLGLGILFLLAGILGFLASAVALATADEVPEIKPPDGVTITLPENDPRTVERKRQAELVLLGSSLSGGGGVVLLGVWFWLKRRS